MKSPNEIPFLSYAAPRPSERSRIRLDGPARLDIGAAVCAGLLIIAVETMGAGGSNRDWWTDDWQSLALFCFYRILESIIIGLPIAAMAIRALRHITNKSTRGCPWWIGMAAIAVVIFWYTVLIDSLMCHI